MKDQDIIKVTEDNKIHLSEMIKMFLDWGYKIYLDGRIVSSTKGEKYNNLEKISYSGLISKDIYEVRIDSAKFEVYICTNSPRI